jgi:alpha-beta hydrolase superfamily lysophospholipase
METPYLSIQGGIDSIVDVFAPIDLETRTQTNDKTTLYYKEMWHDVLIEEEIKEIAPKVAEWVKKRA